MEMLQPTRLNPQETPLVILSEGCFGEHASKTATGVIRYGNWPVTAVIDSTRAGKSVRDVTGIACDAPVVASLAEAIALSPRPKALLIGTAPQGGGLPEAWWEILFEAVRQGLHLISGLHIFLKDNPELTALAKDKGVRLWDVRHSDQKNLVAQQRKRPEKTRVITLVGSDCCVGKMFSALELHQGAKAMGKPSAFVATGQTGILISGNGVPLDRVIGDFMAGHIERAIFEVLETNSPEWIFVEGQGSLLHPGYSGVTMSLLHGSNPDALILCHNPGLTSIWGYDVPLPPLSRLVEIYEQAANWPRHGQRPARVAGVALNTSGFSEAEARRIIAEAEAETGLPVTDPVRFGVASVLASLAQEVGNVSV